MRSTLVVLLAAPALGRTPTPPTAALSPHAEAETPTCAKCGQYHDASPNCCAIGGSWEGLCGKSDTRFTWQSGYQACKLRDLHRPEFFSRDGALFIDDEPLKLRGVNWFGFGTKQGVFSGLYAQPVSWFLDFLERREFNAVRVPLDLDLILNDRQPGLIIPEQSECNQTAEQREQWARWNLNISSVGRSTSTLPTQRGFFQDASRRDRLIQDRAFAERDRLLEGRLCGSHLQGMSSLALLDWFIDQFMDRGIFVLLDLHCLRPNCQSKGEGRSPRPPLFFDEEHPKQLVLRGWRSLARRFASKWNVIGADVFNEPGGATWAAGEPTDFDAFAVEAARAIHAEAPGWLIFVEGTRKSRGCEHCWQYNLRGAQQSPIVLDVPEKLVYSPHMYGPAVVADRDEFLHAKFPDNLDSVWDRRFGHLVSNRTRETPAVVIGEWGGPVEGDNEVWMRKLVGYLQRQKMRSNFFWQLGMAGEPVGLVLDWTQRDNYTNYPLPPVIDFAKVRLLEGLVTQPTKLGQNGFRQVPMPQGCGPHADREKCHPMRHDDKKDDKKDGGGTHTDTESGMCLPICYTLTEKPWSTRCGWKERCKACKECTGSGLPTVAAKVSAGAAIAGPNITLREWLPRSRIVCHTEGQCDLDSPAPKLGGPLAFAANRSMHLSRLNSCQLVVYTVSLDTQLNAELPQPPPGSEGCAFAFLIADRYLKANIRDEQSSATQSSSPEWIPIEVPMDDLPWKGIKSRRNSRVPKLLPHLFFPASVEATVYIDAENSITQSVTDVVKTLLTDCGASFAAQTSPTRFTDVMQEFEVIRYSSNTAEPEKLDEQEAAYRNDTAYMAAVDSGRAVGINAELLVRRNDPQSRFLDIAWMRAYLRGADRDQPAFSYALDKSGLAACRARIGQAKYGEGRCGLACGQGPINLVASARSADCLGEGVKEYCEGQPKGYCEVKPRPAWATEPPSWICDGDLKRF